MTEENKKRSGLKGMAAGFIVFIVIYFLIMGNPATLRWPDAFFGIILFGFPFVIIGYLVGKNI